MKDLDVDKSKEISNNGLQVTSIFDL